MNDSHAVPRRAGKFFSVALLACVLSATAAAQSLRIAHYDTGGVQLPTENMLRAALKRAGIEPVMVEIPLGRALLEADRGVLLDADPARTLEAAGRFSNLVAVGEPLRVITLGAFIRHGAEPVAGWKSLQQRKVVTFSGAVFVERLLQENHLTRVYRADTYTGAALMLAFGRADVALLPVDEAVAALRRYDITMIQPSGPALATAPLYFILNRKHAALAPRIAAAIKLEKSRMRLP
jgi:polar amino acid transport system substrate-binding protein